MEEEGFGQYEEFGDVDEFESVPGIYDRLRAARLPSIIRILRIATIINALALLGAGISAITLLVINTRVVLDAAYVMLFSLCLILFEFRLPKYERRIQVNCGFMYSWCGRGLFLILAGTLTLGFGPIGTFAAITTGINLIFSVFALNIHPDVKYRYYQIAKYKTEIHSRPMIDEQDSYSTPKISKHNAQPSPPPEDIGGGWERVHDQESNQFYYHYAPTGHTQWEAPTGIGLNDSKKNKNNWGVLKPKRGIMPDFKKKPTPQQYEQNSMEFEQELDGMEVEQTWE